jgi:hypothetical protein
MKQKLLLYSMIVAFLCALPISATATIITPPPPGYSNPYSGIWFPTHSDAFLVELGVDSNSCSSLSIFDPNAPESQLTVLTDGVFASASIYFLPVDNGDGSYSFYADTVPGGQALAFVEEPFFKFSFNKCGTSYLEYDLSITSSGGYQLFEANTGLTVLVHDMQTVPVPPALLLFGSGIIGLLGFRRRFNK